MAALAHPPEAAEDLLRRVASWPSIRIDRNGVRASLCDRVSAVAIAELDLRTAALVVDVPSNVPRPKNGAARLKVTDGDERRAAIALLRWRTEIERFAAQYRNASP